MSVGSDLSVFRFLKARLGYPKFAMGTSDPLVLVGLVDCGRIVRLQHSLIIVNHEWFLFGSLVEFLSTGVSNATFTSLSLLTSSYSSLIEFLFPLSR